MKEQLSAAFRILVPRSVVHRQPLLLFVAAAVTGIVIDSAFGGSILLWSGLTAALIVLFAIIRGRKSANPLATMSIVLVMVPLAALWHQIHRQVYDSASILQFVGVDPRPVILDGIVDRPVVLRRHPMADQSWRRDQSPWQTQIEIRSNQIRSGLDWRVVDGRFLAVVSGRRDQLRPGDAVRVYGSIARFSSPANPGERDFRDIYRRRGIHARVHVDSESQIESLEQSIWKPGRWIASIAQSGRERLMQCMGSETGPLAIALVIGQREFVSPDQRDRLLVTGTVHLLSVSGLHLAIIVVLANWAAILLRFPPKAKVAWILAICLLYTAVTGARPPVIRAAVLVMTFLVAFLVKRPSQPINTLSLAALIILAWNPMLVFGIGVQLSFLAVATLLLCSRQHTDHSPAVAQAVQQEERLAALAEKSRSKATFYARSWAAIVGTAIRYSACVTAISMPLVWHEFHVVSPISVVANVVLSPFLFAALASGIATVVFGLVAPLGSLFGSVCDLSIQAMRELIDLAASVPFGHFWLPSPPSWWVVSFYAVILLSLYFQPGKVTSGFRYVWIGLWVIIAWMLATTTTKLDEGSIEATFVDVGHGTSVVVRSDDQVWLYDCGRLGNDTGRSRDIDATLWSFGVTQLNGIFLSHADTDHFNALPGVLQRFAVEQIITPPGMLDDPEPAVENVRRLIKQWKIPIREVADGAVEQIGRQPVQVLHPPIKRVVGSDNANSLVLRIDCGDTSLILPGDLEPPGTALVIEHSRPRPGSVLMAPHHGSLRMDAASVLQWSRPSETIVSGGRRAKRPEVYEMLSARGSAVHVTSQVGAIRVEINRAGQSEVRRWRLEPW
jgi:competence protein ComEC